MGEEYIQWDFGDMLLGNEAAAAVDGPLLRLVFHRKIRGKAAGLFRPGPSRQKQRQQR